MKYVIMSLSIMVVMSCGNKSSTDHAKAIVWDTAAAFSSDSMVEMDDIYVPDFRQEDEAFGLTAMIIQPGYYQSHEVTQEMIDADWYNLIWQNDTYSITQQKVDFKNEVGEYEDTTWFVSGESDADINLANINNIKLGALEYRILDPNVVLPGQNVFFNYGDTHYRIYASGYISGDRSVIKNYRVVLEAQKDGIITKQILFAHSFYSSTRSCIIKFVGDIDNDGQPDIIIKDEDTDAANIMLFLSGSADEGQLLKFSGYHQSYIELGC